VKKLWQLPSLPLFANSMQTTLRSPTDVSTLLRFPDYDPAKLHAYTGGVKDETTGSGAIENYYCSQGTFDIT